MNRLIFVITRLDHLSNGTPKVSIAGSYFDKEQAYENALVLQLEQIIEKWPTQTIQRHKDKILKRYRSLPTTSKSSFQSIFQHLFPTIDTLFEDLCHVSHQVHGCLPVDESATPISATTNNTNAIETPLFKQLMTTIQTLLNDEEDLANSDGEDDEEEEEDDDDEDEVDDTELDADDDDLEDELNDADLVTSNNDNDNNNNDGDEDEDDEYEMDGSDDDDDDTETKNVIEISDDDEDELQLHDKDNQEHLKTNDYDTTTIKHVHQVMDNENTNDDDTDDDFIGGDNGDVTLLSPPHSDQKQSFTDDRLDDDVDDDVDDLDEDEIDELNDDEDEAPNKRRRTDL